MCRDRGDPDRQGQRGADERGKRDLHAAQADVPWHAERTLELRLGEAKAHDRDLSRREGDEDPEAVEAREEAHRLPGQLRDHEESRRDHRGRRD